MSDPASLPIAPGVDGLPRPRTRELAMSAAWHGGLTRVLETGNGEQVTVVFRGIWSHGMGPDFAEAMIQFGNGELQTGAVEIHTRASDWTNHGHHLDQRYNAVILHVVARQDTRETRREDGACVPTVILDIPDGDLFAIDQELPEIWSALGHSVCAEDVAFAHPNRLRAALQRLGDQRFSNRVSHFEGELTGESVGRVLVRAMFDAFGYSENRPPMRLLAEHLIESGLLDRIAHTWAADRPITVTSIIFGLAGFFPLAPADAQFAGFDPAQVALLEAAWVSESISLSGWSLPATMWTLARTRPANHPATRLRQLSSLLVACHGDPTPVLFDCLRGGGDIAGLVRELTAMQGAPGLGSGRAVAITASVILPVAMAHAHHAGDLELEDATAQSWAMLPRSEWSRPARRALSQAVGEAPLGRLGERAMQGLLHLDRELCTPRRCFECPVAAEVIRDRQRQRDVALATIQSMLPT